MEAIKWVTNNKYKTKDKYSHLMSETEVSKAYDFHRSFPEYEATPLVHVPKLTSMLGLKYVFVKDESYRFGLNAFKVLGGSYAIACYIGQQLGIDVSQLPYERFISSEVRDSIGQVTLYTATDGNHGRGVAWASTQLGQKSVVLMPQGSSVYRRDKIIEEGGICFIEDVNYDVCVRKANKMAEEDEHGVIVQDTAWDGYEDIPTWIMQGYGTLIHEVSILLDAMDVMPSHVFLQAGVGSFAGAVTGYLKHRYKDQIPTIIVVEASACDCLYQSALVDDGNIHTIEGDLSTIMAGLACGEPNTIAYDILRHHVDVFVSAPDWVAARGMRILGAPLKGDPQVISGESGAVTCGLLDSIMRNPEYTELQKTLCLDEESVVVLISTEGDTDPVHYREVLWGST